MTLARPAHLIASVCLIFQQSSYEFSIKHFEVWTIYCFDNLHKELIKIDLEPVVLDVLSESWTFFNKKHFLV